MSPDKNLNLLGGWVCVYVHQTQQSAKGMPGAPPSGGHPSLRETALMMNNHAKGVAHDNGDELRRPLLDGSSDADNRVGDRGTPSVSHRGSLKEVTATVTGFNPFTGPAWLESGLNTSLACVSSSTKLVTV
jgi:hypothetical protein